MLWPLLHNYQEAVIFNGPPLFGYIITHVAFQCEELPATWGNCDEIVIKWGRANETGKVFLHHRPPHGALHLLLSARMLLNHKDVHLTLLWTESMPRLCLSSFLPFPLPTCLSLRGIYPPLFFPELALFSSPSCCSCRHFDLNFVHSLLVSFGKWMIVVLQIIQLHFLSFWS